MYVIGSLVAVVVEGGTVAMVKLRLRTPAFSLSCDEAAGSLDFGRASSVKVFCSQ